MKTAELRNLSGEELEQTVRDLKRELFNRKFQWSTGQLEKTDRLGKTRRDIARALSVQQERKRAGEGEKA